jgi:hypothetical protein
MSGTHGGTLEWGVEPPAPVAVAIAPAPSLPRPARRWWKELTAAGIVYFLLSIIVWWGLWSTRGRTTCGCGDSSTFIWYLEWPAYAIAHGLNPLYSTALFHPSGVNLLSNTSVIAVGVPLAPVTWIFGPVASFNVALTLSPPLSALAMYALVRRWVSWAPAAFFAGLGYGFSPFVLNYLADGHIMLGLAVVPPLFVACLDELIFRQRRPALAVGIVAGLLVALQFFIGTEVLLIMMASSLVGLVLIIGYGAVHDLATLRARAGHAVRGLFAGTVTAIVLLAYPAWFALAGPAHLSGSIWPNSIFALGGTSLDKFLTPTPPATGTFFFGAAYFERVGGYQGPILSTHYLGLGVLVVVIAGGVGFRRDRRIWLFGATAVLAVAVALGYRSSALAPWRWLMTLPQFGNIQAERFVLVAYLALGCMVGVILDHTRAAVQKWADHRQPDANTATGGTARSVTPFAGAIGACVVAIIAIVPTLIYLAPTIPMTTQSTRLPTWFRVVAPHLTQKDVLLVVPAPFSGLKGADFWQAVDRMSFSMVGGPGPGAVPARAGRERLAQVVLSAVSVSAHANADINTSDISAVRRALPAWGVTEVVVPDQPDLPLYDRPLSVTTAGALMTAVTGQLPRHQAEAWVWKGWGQARSHPVVTGARLLRCTEGLSSHGQAVQRASACVLGLRQSD